MTFREIYLVQELQAITIDAQEHGITRDKMDKDALNILHALTEKGYTAYLVGGCIRDHLSGIAPKDYDIATNAKPKAIMKIFPKSLLIGRRFPLVHVRIPGKRNKIIEVATFRTKYADYKSKNKFYSWLVKFFIFGDIKQDAQRRDLTSQALYWRASDAAILDFNNGYQDVMQKEINVIGETDVRFNEDAVRILRVLRVNAKLGHNINKDLHKAIIANKHLLGKVSASRLFGEVVKSLNGGFGQNFFALVLKYKLQNILFGDAVSSEKAEKWIKLGLAQADKRYSAGLSRSSGYLFAVILWPMFMKKQFKEKQSVSKEISKIIGKQHRKTVIPKKNAMMIENIWRLQPWFLKTENHTQAKKLTKQNSFRAAYDFLLLRAEFSSEFKEVSNKWTKYLALSNQDKELFSFVEQPEDL